MRSDDFAKNIVSFQTATGWIINDVVGLTLNMSIF